MGSRGRKRDLGRELEYWELLASGIGTVEACRLMGVSRKTGFPWPAEMGGVIAKKRTQGTGRYLSLFQRQRIASLRDRGYGIRAVARLVQRSTSTMFRVLARNATTRDDDYNPMMAHLRAHERARRPKAGKIEQSPWLHSFIQDRLNRRCRPEHIHLHLRLSASAECSPLCGCGFQ